MSNGCKFCRHDDATPILSDSEWEVEVLTMFNANQLYIEFGSGDRKYVDIKCCPMCGRKL